ncbi:hypothetical protein A2U01_0088079, partial [Trifolium medium]|nr:hypothetical protein [Trifolium medium]
MNRAAKLGYEEEEDLSQKPEFLGLYTGWRRAPYICAGRDLSEPT